MDTNGEISIPVFNIAAATLKNNAYRWVLKTNKHSQVVLMSLRPGEEIGTEIHRHVDQFIRIEKGTGLAVLNGLAYPLADDVAVIIGAGVEHNIINTSNSEDLKLYTIYSPPNHPIATYQPFKPLVD